jgi:transposase
MIKASTHLVSNQNTGKISLYNEFLCEYDFAVRFFIDYLWNNRISYFSGKSKEIEHILDIKNDFLDCPAFISTACVKFETKLSARALKSASTQACSIVKSSIDKRKRKLFIFKKLISEKKRTRTIVRRLSKEKLSKPNPEAIYPKLDSNCCSIDAPNKNTKHFDRILVLKSIGKYFGEIKILFNHHRHSKKLEKSHALMSGVTLFSDKIELHWEKESPENKNEGIIVGADTGINSVVTFSDKQQTSANNHGHTLNSILSKIVRKQKGSKAFHKALDHRNNFINESINRMNFSNIKEVHLEKISNFRRGKRTSKFLNYMGETLIRSKILDVCANLGVRVLEQASPYRSQRCSSCGYVYRGNRKGKDFSCKHCSFQADADYNASCNHEINLPSSQFLLYYLDVPKRFFWKEEGFFNLDNSRLTVSKAKKRRS